MLLSVIVPVYNAGEYLPPCIQSLIDLPIEKEIIIIDDGSDDDCVVKLKVKSEKLIVIHQTNQGVSAARNAGLKIAKGEWVWFCDADDKILPQSSLIEREQLDWIDSYLLVLPFIWEENGVSKRFEAQDGEIPYNLWRCWFRREEIERQNLRFVAGRKYGEDQEFILKYLLHCKGNTVALDGPVYHYTMRTSGAMKRPGTRWKQRRDLWHVLWSFAGNALLTGNITKSWVYQHIKRILKNLIII